MNADASSLRNALWEKFARQWRLLGPPLRATKEDAERLYAVWRSSLPHGVPEGRLEVLLLGVTPELTFFPWSADCTITALDTSEPMLRTVWPGDAPGRRGVQGDWLRAPFADGSFDLILNDGGIIGCDSRVKLATLGRECLRLLRPGGRVVIRHFVRPEPIEKPEAVVAAVAAGEIGNFHALKLRLLLALPLEHDPLMTSLPAGLRTFDRLFPDRAALAQQLGCSLETIGTVDAYAGMGDYRFADLAELRVAFPDFEVRTGPPASYPLGACCQVFIFTPRT